MNLYLDTACIAKCYLNEPDGKKVRKLVRSATGVYSSAWCIVELACVFQRHIREGSITGEQAARLRALFLEDVRNGVWVLFPVSDRLLFRIESLIAALPPGVSLRAGDAIHLVSAQDAGVSEIWTNDRHLLGAAAHFGLSARPV